MEANWNEMKGGYRVPYDPRQAVARLQMDGLDPAAWEELWQELHHQGDVDEATYAAVPLLVKVCASGLRDWNFYALVATIEIERFRLTMDEDENWRFRFSCPLRALAPL